MNCPKCNSIVKQGESFCKMCGCKLNQTIPQNNQEVLNVVENFNNEENIKKDIIKYLKGCYIPFAIIFCIYMVAYCSFRYCNFENFNVSLLLLVVYFFTGIFFIIANFVIVLPCVISSTCILLNKFNMYERKLKIVDLIVIVFTGMTSVFLTSKTNFFAFLLVPIITLFYFSKDYISKKTSQKMYFLIIVSLFLGSVITGYVYYKVIIIYNILVIPTISIIFYLLNHGKIKFKISKLIPISLVFILFVFSSYQFFLRNYKSFAEDVKKEKFNLEYKDLRHLQDIVHADNENLYFITTENSHYDNIHYLSKYNIENKKFEILFSDVEEAISEDKLIFFYKDYNIYMIDTENGEIKKIINKKYYGKINRRIFYDNGKLYFSLNNKIYSYNVSNSKIKSFVIDENERIIYVFDNSVITEYVHHNYDVYGKNDYTYYLYNSNGQKVKLSLDFDLFHSFNYKKSFYFFSYKENSLLVYDFKNDQSFKYKFNLNDIYQDETKTNIIRNIENPSILGVYHNKMYILIRYTIKNKESKLNTEYAKIYYFDLNNLNEDYDFKLNAIDIEIDSTMYTYLLDNYIYLSDYDNGKVYKYNLDNNNVINSSTAKYCCSFENSYDNYIYGSTSDDTIYRIDKNSLKTEKILGRN